MTDKAQEHNFPKYNLDADFWRNRWVESSAEALQQELKFIKLEKKLATAVEALELFGDSMDMNTAVIAQEALAEIRGEQDD